MLPIFVKIGPIAITSFGLMLAIGFLLALFFFFRAVKDRIDVSVDQFFDSIFLLSLFSFIGARVFYIIFHFEDFGLDILSWILFRQSPGLSYVGAVISFFVAFFFFKRVSTIPWWQIIDNLVPGLIIFSFFAHLGSLLDGFSFGTATSLPWGVAILGSTIRYHPLPAYYLVPLLSFMILSPQLYRLAREANWPKGRLFLLFVALYSLASFLLNQLREEKTFFHNIPVDDYFSLLVFFVACLLIYRQKRSFLTDIKNLVAFFLKKLQNKT